MIKGICRGESHLFFAFDFDSKGAVVGEANEVFGLASLRDRMRRIGRRMHAVGRRIILLEKQRLLVHLLAMGSR